MKMKKILVMNGPNLDMLGMREPEIYGDRTLASLEEIVMQYGAQHGVEVVCFQSNSESKLINQIHKAPQNYDGVVFNPGAYTHYSYAIRDAISSIDTPVVEVHISDIDEREPFRQISVIAPACAGQIKGLGFDSYLRGIDVLTELEASVRLGEGYEKQFPLSQQIMVAGKADAPSPARDEDVVTGEIVYDDAALRSFERLNLLRLACARLGVGALYVRDTPNIRWLTALDEVFDEERAHALLVAANLALLHTDSRYAQAFKRVLEEHQVDITLNDAKKSHVRFAFDTLNPSGQESFNAKLGFEDNISYAEFARLVDAFTAEWLAPTTDIVLKLRAVKDGGEIARLKAAQAIADAAFEHIVSVMKPGMTEREVQVELDHFMLTHGAEGLAFASIVACGPNGADPHSVPGNAHLKSGQCVVLDFGARAYGYCSDMTRTVFLGQPDSTMEKAWRTLQQANEQVEALLRPGITGKEAHMRAERILEENGFGGKMGHGLGHGVGLEVHELPVLSPRNEMPLVEGNVVTVEPGIYIPGKFGMRLEDFGVITEDGFDVFTQSTHEMVII